MVLAAWSWDRHMVAELSLDMYVYIYIYVYIYPGASLSLTLLTLWGTARPGPPRGLMPIHLPRRLLAGASSRDGKGTKMGLRTDLVDHTTLRI